MTMHIFIKRVIIAVAALEVKIWMGIKLSKKLKLGQSHTSSYTATTHLNCTLYTRHSPLTKARSPLMVSIKFCFTRICNILCTKPTLITVTKFCTFLLYLQNNKGRLFEYDTHSPLYPYEHNTTA